MSGHGANSVFFNIKCKDWTSRTLAKTSHPLRPITYYLCATPHLLKVDFICAWNYNTNYNSSIKCVTPLKVCVHLE